MGSLVRSLCHPWGLGWQMTSPTHINICRGQKKKKEGKGSWPLGEPALCHALEGCYLMYSDVTSKNEQAPVQSLIPTTLFMVSPCKSDRKSSLPFSFKMWKWVWKSSRRSWVVRWGCGQMVWRVCVCCGSTENGAQIPWSQAWWHFHYAKCCHWNAIVAQGSCRTD